MNKCSAEMRFVKKITPNNGCWEWNGQRNRKGYGVFWDGTKQVLAHRYSYAKAEGLIPEGMFVLHKCDNPSCVNPSHLFVGTAADNTSDMMNKKRHISFLKKNYCLSGEKHVMAKLTTIDVESIKKDYFVHRIPVRDISKKFKISQSEINRILIQTHWRDHGFNNNDIVDPFIKTGDIVCWKTHTGSGVAEHLGEIVGFIEAGNDVRTYISQNNLVRHCLRCNTVSNTDRYLVKAKASSGNSLRYYAPRWNDKLVLLERGKE